MVYSRCSLLEVPLVLDTVSTLRAMEFGFWTSLLRCLLLCGVANSALFPDGVHRTDCHDRYFMIAMDLSFTGQQFYFEAVDGTGTFPITEQYAAQCGYTVTILYAPDLVELRASYFSCHTMNQNDDTFAFNFNLVVNQTGRLISYALNETCSLNLPWSPREVTCDVNYLEVSVQSDVVCPLAPKPNIWDTSMEMVYSSASPGWQVVFLNENGEGKPMNLTEANLNGYTLTLTENRMVLRAAYGQRHSFITMIDGVFVEVVHAILFTRQDWLVLLVDLVAACTMYDSVNNHGGYMIWETPQTLYPGFPTTNFSFGLNGELREPTVATDLGYNLNESDARVLIGIPYNAEGTYRISVVDGDLYDLYTCNFYMEQLSSNRGLETRVRAYKKLSSPLIKSSIFTENRTVPDEKMFTVYLYNVPDDAELVSVQLENQKFNGPFVNSSFYTLDIAVNQNYTYSYTLKVPFDSPFVISRFSAENEATENKLNVVFTVFVRPQNEPYSYHTTVTALTGVAFPQFNTSCSKTGITFKRHHQPSDFLWDITVGSELLTTELAAKQGYVLSNDSHMLQLDVPLFTQGYQYENVSLKGFVGTFKILVRDHKTFKIQSVIVETCLFTTTEEIVVCSKDGTMSVVVNLSKVSEAGGSPNRTTLLDKACTPEEADEKSARFAFPLNSCDSRVKLNKEFLTYENEILFSLNSSTLSSSVLVQCSYPLIGLYSLFTTYQFQSEIAGFGKIVHPSNSIDLPIPTTSPTKGLTSSTRRPDPIYHTTKRNKNRLGYKSPIHYIKVSRRFKNL